MYKKLIIILFVVLAFSQDEGEVSSVFTGSFGSVTLDDQIYNHFSLRPEMSVGKLGIGMDIYFYFDNEGNLSDNNWNFNKTNNSFKTIVDKLYYIRWGIPEDDYYLRFGALPNTTLGFGSLVNNYSNEIDYPKVRRKGLTFNYSLGEFSIQFIHSDFKEYNAPSLLATSVSFEFFEKLNLNMTIATDPNQLNGLYDRDDDGKVDIIDHFPDDSEYWHEYEVRIEELNDITSLAGEPCFFTHYNGPIPNPDDINNDGYHDTCADQQENYNNFMHDFIENSNLGDKKNDAEISGLSFGLSYDLTDRFAIYSEFTQLFGKTTNPYDSTHDEYEKYDNKLGSGFIPIGFKANWDRISFTFDYRQNTEKFLFGYWDQNYDNNRVTVYQNSASSDAGVTAYTKEDLLYKYGKSQGIQLALATYIKYFGFSFSYAHMNSDLWNNEGKKYKSDDNNTLYVKFDIDTSMIDKVRIAEIFYQQSHVSDPFDFDPNENSLFGYNLGIDMAENMSLILKGRKSYIPSGFNQNNKTIYDSVRSTQIETQIIF